MTKSAWTLPRLVERYPVSYRFGEEEEVIFGFYAEILEDGVGPEPFHVILQAVSPSTAQLKP